jgi:hypothetical protein
MNHAPLRTVCVRIGANLLYKPVFLLNLVTTGVVIIDSQLIVLVYPLVWALSIIKKMKYYPCKKC